MKMISSDTKTCKYILKSAGLRLTCARLKVLNVLCRANKPVTHEQISKKLGDDSPNKVTIYRILDSFLKNGLVHKAFLRNRTWHFELSNNCTEKQCHPHFTCTLCGQTECLPEVCLPMAKSPKKGLIINHQSVQLEGLCQQCNSKEEIT